jgi:hypothetical protein
MFKTFRITLPITVGLLAVSSLFGCKKISWSDYKLLEYDGELLWEQVTEKTDWQYLYYSDNGVDWFKDYDSSIVEEGYMWRTSHEMFYSKDKIWTLPGKANSNVHYHFATDQYYSIWTYDNTGFGLDSKGTAIDARHGYSTVVFKDYTYVLGGNTNRKGQDNDIWEASLK